MELARHIKLHLSGSVATLYLYTRGVEEYCRLHETDPDTLIRNCTTTEGLPSDKALKIESRRLDDYVGALKDQMYSPGHISNCVKAVKALFRQNGLELRLPYKLHKYTVSRDRAPTPEEIERMTELANLRDKIVVLMLALSGVRVGTLCKLQYRHIRNDIERGIVPIHIHVEAEITKGKYSDYDTFVGKEASDLLNAYLEARRNGGLPNKIPPESINDETPLIRDEHAKIVKPLTPSQVYNIVHKLISQAGLLGSKTGKRYQVRPHSLRKFFRTQLASLGVQTDYIEYMMGHTVSTYHDVQMNGVEFLRNIYNASGLCIKSKTKPCRMEMLKEMIRSLGLNPEQILTKEAMSMLNRTVVRGSEHHEGQMDTLLKALRQKLKEELFEKPMAESKTV
jgi:integrase